MLLLCQPIRDVHAKHHANQLRNDNLTGNEAFISHWRAHLLSDFIMNTGTYKHTYTHIQTHTDTQTHTSTPTHTRQQTASFTVPTVWGKAENDKSDESYKTTDIIPKHQSEQHACFLWQKAHFTTVTCLKIKGPSTVGVTTKRIPHLRMGMGKGIAWSGKHND